MALEVADPRSKNIREKARKASQIPEVASIKFLLQWNKVIPCVLSGATYKVFRLSESLITS